MIINNATDYANAPVEDQEKLKSRLAAGVNQWRWVDGEWVLFQNTKDLEIYGLNIDNLGEITTPAKPDYNPDEQLKTQLNQERIAELQQNLRDTDYVALPDYDQDKPDIIAERQAWRDEIRELEQSL